MMPEDRQSPEKPLLESTLPADTATDADADSGPHRPLADWSSRRFRPIRAHAKGGLGEVFLAEDLELNRRVALKEIQARHCDLPESRARFALEAEITGGLEHPGIVPVYSLGQYTDGRPFYAMRFIQGESLADAIARFHAGSAGPEGPLDLRQLLRRFLDVTNAVAYAHSRGIIHRDIKPANVMLGDFGESLLVDWGLAKAVGRGEGRGERGEGKDSGEGSFGGGARGEQSDTRAGGVGPFFPSPLSPRPSPLLATQHGSILGTPAYMSPEQAAGRHDEVGPASDVYSLGATLYTILTGDPPVTGLDREEVLDRVRRGDFPRPRQVRTTAPKPLEAICLKAMATEPALRYDSARELAVDVEHFLADEPVPCYRDSVVERAGRFARRHRAWAQAGAAALLLVTAISIGAAIAVNHQRGIALAQRAAAETQRTAAEQNYSQAKAAIDRYVETATEAELLKEDRFAPVLKDLLADARGFYEELARRPPGTIEERAELAAAFTKLGRIGDLSGSIEEAKQSHRRAAEMYGQLQTEQPDEGFRRGEADSNFSLGELSHRTGDIPTAEGAYLAALDGFESLSAADPADNKARRGVARTNLAIGIMRAETGDAEAALAAYQRALAIQDALAAQDPADRVVRKDLTATLSSLATLEQRRGNASDALHALARAIEVCERLAAEKPEIVAYRSRLALLYAGSSDLSVATGRGTEALESCRKALEIQRQVAAEHPTDTGHLYNLATIEFKLANILKATGQVGLARESYDRAIALQERLVAENATVALFRSGLARSYNNLAVLQAAIGDHQAAFSSVNRAIAIGEGLVAESPQSSKFAGELATYFNALGMVHDHQGNESGGLDAMRRAMAIRERLADQSPGVAEVQGNLADSLYNVAIFTARLGDDAGALNAHRRALAIHEKLAADSPAITENQSDAAASLNDIGLLEERTGDVESAIESFTRAAAIQERLVAENPAIVDYASALARTLNNLGLIHSSRRESKPAQDAIARAAAILERLVEANPSVVSFQRELASTYINAGVLANAGGDLAVARTSFERALPIRERLAAANPTAGPQSELAACYNNLALVQKRTGELDLALAGYQAAVKLEREVLASAPMTVEFKHNLGGFLSNLCDLHCELDNPTDAAAATVERRTLWVGNGDELYRVVAGFAKCAATIDKRSSQGPAAATERARLLDLALETLAEAIAAGFKDASRLDQDPDLEPVRLDSRYEEIRAKIDHLERSAP